MARVLLVDDDKMVMESYIDMLREAGHAVVFCDRLDEAVAAFERAPFDVLVLDLMLPPGARFENRWRETGAPPGALFRDFIRQQNDSILIIFLTNFSNRLRDSRCLDDPHEVGFAKRDYSPVMFSQEVGRMLAVANVS